MTQLFKKKPAIQVGNWLGIGIEIYGDLAKCISYVDHFEILFGK